ncbi:MAG: GH25 family lysozyme, partial [Longicatena sp.]
QKITFGRDTAYFMGDDGSSQEGIFKVNNGYFYFDGKGNQTISGHFVEKDDNVYYYDHNNVMAIGWTFIGYDKYYFNPTGALIGNGPVRKILDISENNEKINWEEVKDSGVIDGVILRIGYGYDLNDPFNQIDKTFIYNYNECKRLGIPVGLYLYSYGESLEDSTNEAKRIISLLGLLNIKPHDLAFPIYYDLEEFRDASLPLTEMAVNFSEIIKSAGFNPGIYASTYYYYDFLDYDAIKNYSLWVAQYADFCEFKYSMDGWQYTSIGLIPGISTNVDISVWF